MGALTGARKSFVAAGLPGARMCRQVAWALLSYAMLVMVALTLGAQGKQLSIAPAILLVVLVAAAVPFFRGIDRQWRGTRRIALSDHRVETRYRRDIVTLWSVALGIPAGIALLALVTD